jgi:arabinan endo-1,5-alpha-L-arabinosidase
VIKAKDGYWYAYGTSDPLREGEEHSYIPVSCSEDLVYWEYVGDTFDTPSDVSCAAGDAGIWAPDVRCTDGKYYMYSTTSGWIDVRRELVEAYRQEDDFAEEIRTAKGT